MKEAASGSAHWGFMSQCAQLFLDAFYEACSKLHAEEKIQAQYLLNELTQSPPQYVLRADVINQLTEKLLSSHGLRKPLVLSVMFHFFSQLPPGAEEQLAGHLARGLRMQAGDWPHYSSIPTLLQRALVDTFLREFVPWRTRWWWKLRRQDGLTMILRENKHLMFAIMVMKTQPTLES